MMTQGINLLLLSTYTQSAPPQDVIIKNNAEGCFTLNTNQLELDKDPVYRAPQ